MKVMFDIDPKSLKKLESLASAKRLSIGELSGELIQRVLNRDPGHGPAASSASGIHAVTTASTSASGRLAAMGGAAEAKAAPVAAPEPSGMSAEHMAMLLEPVIARFRLCDNDGSQRRAVLAELSMILPDPAAERIIDLLKRSLD